MKGKVGEREVAAVINARWPHLDARRSAGQCRKGSDAPDVHALAGVWIEIKRTEREQPRKALEQAEREQEAAGGGRVPVAVLRPSRKRWMAALYFDDLLELFDAAGLVPVALPLDDPGGEP